MVGERSTYGVAEIVTSGRGDRRWRVALAVASVCVYLFFVALAAGGVWLEWITFPNPFAMLPVAAMLGAAWYARPRPNSPEPPLLDRADHPVLHELADTIADELGCARGSTGSRSPWSTTPGSHAMAGGSAAWSPWACHCWPC